MSQMKTMADKTAAVKMMMGSNNMRKEA